MKLFRVCAVFGGVMFSLWSNLVFAELFDIPPGSLGQTLDTYTKTTGQNLVYMDSLVEGKNSPGVKGNLSPTQAIDKILAGTGLSVTLTSQGDMVLQENAISSPPAPKKQPTQRENTAIQSGRMQLDQIVVTATKTPIKTKDVPAAINMLTDEDIRLRANTDNFVDTISTLPGVIVVRGGMSDTLAVRGMNPSILVNGRDMNFFTSLTGPEQTGMGSIERIEVIKGPQAAIYGAKAISGVVNIIQKKGDIDNPFGELRGFLGQGNEYNLGASLGGGFNKLSYFMDITVAEQDKYKTPKGDIPYMDSDHTNAFARFDYAFSQDHEVTFDFSYNRSQKTVGGDGYYYTRSEWNNLYSFGPEYQSAFFTYNGKYSDFLSVYANIGLARQEYELVYGMPNYEPEHFLNKDSETLYKEDILQGEIRGTAKLLPDNRLLPCNSYKFG